MNYKGNQLASFVGVFPLSCAETLLTNRFIYRQRRPLWQHMLPRWKVGRDERWVIGMQNSVVVEENGNWPWREITLVGGERE